jgi:DNA-binding NarL/FixJ family response regulator
MTKSLWRVLVVDDHELIRMGVKMILDATPGYEVVGEAEDGREALRQVASLRPDLVIMDIAMPGLNGIEGTQRIRKEFPGTKVLVLSMHLERNYVRQTLKAGASGYVLKERAVEEVPLALDCINSGKKYLSPGVTDMVLEGYLEVSGDVPDSAFSDLTDRERDVLQLLAEGKTIKECASVLHLSPKTVETHKRRIYERLNINSIAGLTHYAIRHGIVSLD